MDGSLAVSSKYDDKNLIWPKKYRNSNNTIRTAVGMIFNANRHMFSPELPAEQSSFLLDTLYFVGKAEKTVYKKFKKTSPFD